MELTFTYWTDYPSSLTVMWTTEDPAPSPPIGFHVATPLELSQIATDSDVIMARSGTNLLFSPSKKRTNPQFLNDGFILSSSLVAIFIEDNPVLGITQIDFDLDTVLHHTETGAPWDYDGTDGFGDANRVTFAVGTHTVDAHILATTGNFTVSATFEVE